MDRDKNNGLLARIQNYMMSYSGKTLINYFYSWGAAIVILGTLFKLTHLPGANLMLYIGMGTEVFVFIISAFDRPTKTYRWESVFPNLEIAGRTPKKKEEDEGGEEDLGQEGLPESVLQGMQGVPGGAPGEAVAGGVVGSTPTVVYVGGNGPVAAGEAAGGESPAALGEKPSGFSPESPVLPQGGSGVLGAGGVAMPVGSMPQVPDIPVKELEEATQEYLGKLKEMAETLGRLNEQLSGFACDPGQMEGVNRHLAGLNAIFELQLRSASKQVESVDKVHEQTERMAAQIEELNKVYARMLQAMTANMVYQQHPINQ